MNRTTHIITAPDHPELETGRDQEHPSHDDSLGFGNSELLEEFRAMPNQVLAATVTRVLTHEAIMSVNFELDGLLVTGMRYQAVTHAIAAGKISCEVGVAADPNLPAGAVAECLYDPTKG